MGQAPTITTSTTPSTAHPLVRGRDIHKSFRVGDREVAVLHGVNVEVNPGELVAIMGQSGSGKSTLLYCLAGLEKPTHGDVIVNDQQLNRLGRSALARMRRTTMGFVFQQYNLVPTLSAFENIALPWRLNRRKPDRALISSVMDTMGLADLASHLPGTMSGGEQQRVALARVMAQQPRIIFADEPTGALDTRTSVVVLDQIVQLAHSPGQCALMVTHDPLVASRCDRVIFMKDGVLDRQLRHPRVESITQAMNDLLEGR